MHTTHDHTDTTDHPAPDHVQGRRPRRGAEAQRPSTRRRRPGRLPERAEGVISTAIAVLVVAFLGIGLWKGFDVMMDSAADRTRTQVEQIGG